VVFATYFVGGWNGMEQDGVAWDRVAWRNECQERFREKNEI
jgi:hypothetical protein